MTRRPAPAGPSFPLADGVVALAGGIGLLARSRVLLVADAHFGYEDVMGGGAALPLWSTAEMVAAISIAARRSAAREIVFLGDVIQSPRMSAGAAREVSGALAELREVAALTFVAGNHEGSSRGAAVLGATVEMCERDGWLLVHGDKPPAAGRRTIIGHLHPSVHLGGGASLPAFLAGERIVVVPALTPYSSGLDVLSAECLAALSPWNARHADLQVVVTTSERVFPFGALTALRAALTQRVALRPPPRGFRRRRRLEPN